jgi:tetratricopeptide (TPR) repeat protein
MRVKIAPLAVLCLLGGQAGGAQPPSWTRVVTPRFTVSAELPPEQAVAVTTRLEQFRAAIERALPEGRLPSILQTFVVVFATDESFRPYKPTHQGGTAPVSGFVVNDEFSPCLALHFERGEESYRTIFHEYAHLLVQRAAPGVPLWFTEGAAEFYSTLAPADDGRSARLGRPVDRHVLLLRRRFVPLAQLLDTTRETADWQGPEGQLFYAESWALVHYLLAGNHDLAGKVPAFLARLSSGAPQLRAFEEAFGQVALVERDLRNYVQRGSYPWRDLPVPAGDGGAPLEVPMSAAQVDATLGRLLFHLQRDAAAEERLQRALGSDSALFEAHLTLGLMRLRQQRFGDAVPAFERAQALQPGHLLVAHNLALAALQRSDTLDDERLERARAGLAKVLAPGTRASEPWGVLGALSGRLGMLEEAERGLRLALELSPDRLPTLLELIDVCVAREKFDEAERVLESAAPRAARAGLDLSPWRDRVAGEREIARVRADLLKAAASVPQAARPPAGEIPRTGRWLVPPDYRKPAAGETKVHGLLQRIDCDPGRVVVHLAASDGPLRLEARAIADIMAISYREGFDPLLGCGARRGWEPVFATLRPAGQAASPPGRGIIVALEFLGDEYLPRPPAR